MPNRSRSNCNGGDAGGNGSQAPAAIPLPLPGIRPPAADADPSRPFTLPMKYRVWVAGRLVACLLALASCAGSPVEPALNGPDQSPLPASRPTPTPQPTDSGNRAESEEAGSTRPATPDETSTSDQAAPEEPSRLYIDGLGRQFVLLGAWTHPEDEDVVCEDAFIVTAEAGVLRAGPDTEHRQLTSVPRLTPLPVQETRGSWHRVAMAGIGVVPDHWIAEEQGRMGGWCIHLFQPDS